MSAAFSRRAAEVREDALKLLGVGVRLLESAGDLGGANILSEAWYALDALPRRSTETPQGEYGWHASPADWDQS